MANFPVNRSNLPQPGRFWDICQFPWLRKFQVFLRDLERSRCELGRADQIWPAWTNVGPSSTTVARFGPEFQSRPNSRTVLADVDRVMPITARFVRFWSTLVKFGSSSGTTWPTSTKSGRFGPNLGRFGPNLARNRPHCGDAGQTRTQADQVLVDFGGFWTDFGRIRPDLARYRPNLAGSGRTWTIICSNSCDGDRT